jgi:hypothetical protein
MRTSETETAIFHNVITVEAEKSVSADVDVNNSDADDDDFDIEQGLAYAEKTIEELAAESDMWWS